MRQSFTPNQRFHTNPFSRRRGTLSVKSRASADAKDAGVLAVDLDVVDGGHGRRNQSAATLRGLVRIHGGTKEHVSLKGSMEATPWFGMREKVSRKSSDFLLGDGAGVQPTMSEAAAAQSVVVHRKGLI